RNKNILLIAGAGAGKTEMFVKPNLSQLHSSYVVTDPKGKLLHETGKMMSEHGYTIKCFNVNANIKLKQVFHEFDFLISQGLGFDRSFETIGKDLKATYQETEKQLDKLDTKIIEYVEQNKSLDYVDTTIRDTIKNLKLERDDLRDTLYKVDKNIQYYQKSEQRLEAYQKNQSPKHKARDDDFEI
ncbi:type IV secretory system conjugative DNA transfer family protein, partial [Lactococcus cremoris]